MAKTKVLVTVKTYPTLSQKYDELVCTAGFLEDGSWIRVYPVPFRKLDTRYKKWQWIELESCKKVREKYLDEFARKKDLHFFLGTTMVHHFRSRNPFIIIGTFTPPLPQPKVPSLFDFENDEL